MIPTAAFVDRDGTIIAEQHYISEPDNVLILKRVPEAIATLNRIGVPVVVITNQSGIGRERLTEDDFRSVQAEIERQLAERGCRLDAVYHCPHDPTRTSCKCRKPGLALYERARQFLGSIDLSGAIYIGDRLSDVLPAVATGGRGFLVRTGHPVPESIPAETEAAVEIVSDLWEAVERALQEYS